MSDLSAATPAYDPNRPPDWLNQTGYAPGAQNQTGPAAPTADASQDYAANAQKLMGKSQKGEAKARAQHVEDVKRQVNEMLAGASYAQTHGADVNTLAQKIAPLIAQLPSADAQQLMGSGLLKGTPLGTAVGNFAVQGPAAGQPAKPAAPAFDPLALQTMWHDVFGPAYNQARQMVGTVGPGYLAGMNQAIAGAHQSPQATKQLQGQATMMANLLQGYGNNQVAAVPAGMSFDTLINALGTYAGAAQQAQGAAEKNVGYQQAQMYANPVAGGTSTVNPANLLAGVGITPAQQIGANQTGPSLAPNIIP
jgi:hypothetical protein